MKKLIGFLIMAVFVGCTCLGQLTTQYLYLDEDCLAQIPDYTIEVIATDNCDGVITITQFPAIGAYASVHFECTLTATDASGNTSNGTFQVMLIDTIPPSLAFSEVLTYNAEDIGKVYNLFAGWVIQNIGEFEREFDWEQFQLDPNDPNMKCYRNIICPDYMDWLIQ